MSVQHNALTGSELHDPKVHETSHESGGGDELDFDQLTDGTTYKKLLATERTKLAGIDTGATKYPDTGEQAFLDADHTKLDEHEIKIAGTWTNRTPAADYNWHCLCWSPKLRLFAAGCYEDGGSNKVMTSPDGITWTLRTATDKKWYDACWSPELSQFLLLASGNVGNQVITSPDGINWTNRATSANYWNKVCWSPELSLYVAVGSEGASRVMTSPDGITWTGRTAAAANLWFAVCWSPELSLFVATAISGTNNRIMTSPDGITWTIRTSPADYGWSDVVWSQEKEIFVATAYTGGSGDRVMTSPDGITWTLGNIADRYWEYLIWSAELSLFIAVSSLESEGNDVIATSPDGINWTLVTAPNNLNWHSIAWAPELSLLVIVGGAGTGNRVMTSYQEAKYCNSKVSPLLENYNIDTDQITSGTLPVARGGTGVTGDTYDADKVDGCHAGGVAGEVWKLYSQTYFGGVFTWTGASGMGYLTPSTEGYQLTTHGNDAMPTWAAASDLIFSDTHCPKCGLEFQDGDDLILHVIGHNEVGDILTIPMHQSCAAEPKKTVTIKRKVMEDQYVLDELTGEPKVQRVRKMQEKTVTKHKMKEGYVLDNKSGKALKIDKDGNRGKTKYNLSDALETVEETVSEVVYEDVEFLL